MSGSGTRQDGIQGAESGHAGPPAEAGFRIGDILRGERVTLGRSLLDVQRDLRIRAAFIAAIEDCDVTAFPSPGVIPGFVRAYGRYLGLDPDAVYARFCADSGFAGTGREAAAARPRPTAPRPAAKQAPMAFPLAQKPPRALPRIPFAALGSVLVLAGLIGALGYGGWVVLQNVQRVQFAPVEEVPTALAEVAPLDQPDPAEVPQLPAFAAPVAATALADLYRQQELEVPILAPRDGPIAGIDPERIGLLARRSGRLERRALEAAAGEAADAPVDLVAELILSVATAADLSVADLSAADLSVADAEEDAPDAAAPAAILVIAERPAWIRVYTRTGSVLFERILETGETYAIPQTEGEPPMIWAGNSGSVYLKIGNAVRGPIGSGTRAARDVPLDPDLLTERFGVVADLPGIVAETIGAIGRQGETVVQ